MSREAQNVPIATLAGIANIGDFLSELPLPKKAQDGAINLFPNSKTSQDAWKLIQKHDMTLASELAHVLSQVNTDHLQFKKEVRDDVNVSINDRDPKILTLLLQHMPGLFHPKGVASQQLGYPSLNAGELQLPVAVSTNVPQQNDHAGMQYPPQMVPSHPGVHSGGNFQTNGATYNNEINAFSPLKTRAMRAGKQITSPNIYHHNKEHPPELTPVPVTNDQASEHRSNQSIKRNLNNSNKFSESPLSTNAVQIEPPTTDAQNSDTRNKSNKHSGVLKNGYIMPSGVELQDMEKHKNEMYPDAPDNNGTRVSNTISNEISQQQPVSDKTTDADSTLNKVIIDKEKENKEKENEQKENKEKENKEKENKEKEKHFHSSKRNKKSKKHKLKNGTNIEKDNLESNTVNAVKEISAEAISVLDTSEKFPCVGTPLVPKIVLARTKLPKDSTESSNFTVKESLINSEHREEKSLKRRRSSEELTLKGSEGKRKKIEYEISEPFEVSTPPKPSKRYAPRLEDDYRKTTSFKRFSEAMGSVFDFDDQCDMTDSMENDSQQEVQAEFLVTRAAISEMCTETAKLKSMDVISKVDEDDLSRLILIMKRHVKDGMNLQLTSCQDEDEEQKLWKGLYMDRILRSFDASLLVLHIMTASNMPKKVYMEEVIERIVGLIRYHLQQNIFPEYDPIYKVESDTKEGALIATKTKRARSANKRKIFVELYNKICEAVSSLGDLMDIERLTDTIVLQISSVGTSPFFVENVSELQHSALKLVRTTFRKYLKHRELILEEIFASLARLPSSKRNLRSYRVQGEDCIQMVTALVLQLIQCSVRIEKKCDIIIEEDVSPEVMKMDRELEIVGSYENSLRTAQNFLSMFLNKCNSAGKDEEDYRPLFENFLQDLLVTLNRNDWPAAEVLLTLLGRLLVMTFSSRSNDMGLRVASLDYLGVVAAHLRRSSILNQEQEREELLAIISEITDDDTREQEEIIEFGETDNEIEQALQKYLLKYFHIRGKSDPALLLARQFYLCQWIRDIQTELEKAYKATVPNGNESDLPSSNLVGSDVSVPALEAKKSFLFSLIDDESTQLRIPGSSLDYAKANLVAKYLSSKRSFLKSFDIYLQQILRVLNETAVAIRTKAMKALSAIVSVDPSILAREDMQKGVHGRFMDQSTSVREAAVELVGRFVLNKPELTHQYYEMIMERILDTGVSVRKRVIKILKDICIAQPDFPKITEICVKMIRRINDADGIKELVTKVFHQMWFVPVEKGKSEQDDLLLKRVTNIADVVTAFGESGCEWLQQLVENLTRSDDESDSLSAGAKQVLQACSQIVDCLVDRLLTLEEKAVTELADRASNSHRLIGCLTTLYLMSKVQPSMLIKHATTLQPYLSTKCSTQGDHLILHYVARILELVIPLIEHPGEAFLASMEEDLMKLIIKQGQTVVQSCIACLAAVINKVSHNYKLIKDCFQRYFGFLLKIRNELTQNPSSAQLKSNRPLLLRSLFTLGLLCKHFDFENELKTQNNDSVSRQVYTIYIYFSKSADEEISQKAIVGLGFLCIRYPKLLLEDEARELYQNVLSPTYNSVKLKLQILRNVQQQLVEEENTLHLQNSDWKQKINKENLKELGDVHSGTTSEIMQLYLKRMLEAFLHPQLMVRLSALNVVNMILRQGFVHPVQCVSYLIAIGTDSEPGLRTKAAQRLEEIDSKYPGFVQMKALAGVKMSFELQKVLFKDEPILRGFRDDRSSVLSHLYLILRTSRQHRRSFLLSLLRMFDDEKKNCLELLLYLVDNIAFFPYSTLAEPLFIIHNIDTKLSFSGINVLQSFQQALRPVKTGEEAVDEDVEDTADTLAARLPENLNCLESCWKSWQSCILLLYLRQHLKDMYALNDSKCRKYLPSEPSKAYDKGITRKAGVKFNPTQTISCLESACVLPAGDELARQFMEFKTMIMNLDKSDEDSDHDSNGRDSPADENSQENCQEEKVVSENKVKEKRPTKSRKTPGKKTPGNSRGKTKPKAKKKRKRPTYDLDGLSDEEYMDFDDTAYVPH